MFGSLARKIFGSRNDRIIKTLRKQNESINALTQAIGQLTDEQLKAKTTELRQALEQGKTLEAILPEAFAVVREASTRVLGLRHYDVQMIGAMVLNDGMIAEMRTGEGKTLVATLAVYLNALSGKGVHVVTVNDYLAQRDSDWMGRLYQWLGLSVGVIVGGLDHEARRAAYACDITYGTNNEFGFDYLRDNMAMSTEEKVQRGLHFAIVDEVDSILIDEARTPLIISGPAADTSELYQSINVLMPKLADAGDEHGEGDFYKDEKSKAVHMTEQGHEHVEQLMANEGLLQENESLYDSGNIALLHHLNAALRAHVIYQKDVDYIVRDDQIVIVDEFTGRTMPGRRWSEGLHQAIEAKEGVAIQKENQTLASITFQNYFRLYEKLGGMTGTADTEAVEFHQIYGLEVVVIPTHQDIKRTDHTDVVYLTQQEKFIAIAEDIKQCVERQQPVLVGTTSIETSELLSSLLNEKSISHEVLNAKQHEREAHIVAQAGSPSAVTIATNMAGRGTDIVLGGNLDEELAGLGEGLSDEKVAEVKAAWKARHDQVLKSGGLHIIGTERHESRRIDNQLRGRSGRQGDVGSTRFYLSLEDSLMRIFASEKVSGLMQKLGMEDGEAIEHPWVSRSIENAQRKVEGHNFDIRKHILQYDDVANDQRKVIYQQRNELIAAEEVNDIVVAMREDVVDSIVDQYLPPETIIEQWDIKGAEKAIADELNEECELQTWLDEDKALDQTGVKEKVLAQLIAAATDKEDKAGDDTMRRFEKFVVMSRLDEHWKEHLAAMDYLRQSVGLRGYAQKKPEQEFKRESFELFSDMLDAYKREVVTILSRVQIRESEEVDNAQREYEEAQDVPVQYQHAASPSPLAQDQVQHEDSDVVTIEKVGRNEACPCGSGKKYKQCHGKLA